MTYKMKAHSKSSSREVIALMGLRMKTFRVFEENSSDYEYTVR